MPKRARTLLLLLALIIPGYPAKAVSLTDIDRAMDPIYTAAENACTYTGGFSGWGWTCSVYDSLRTLRRFVYSFEGQARDLAVRAAKSSFAGIMEAVGAQPFMQTINDYAERINASADYWFERFPDDLAEDVSDVFYDLSYEATDAIFKNETNPYPPLSAPWFYQNLKQHGPLAGVIRLDQAFSTQAYLDEKLRVESGRGTEQEALANLDKRAGLLGQQTVAIAADPGPLGGGGGSNAATSNSAAISQGTASPLANDVGSNTASGGGGGSLSGFQPLAYSYKEQAKAAVSSRDLMQIMSSELADLLSGQAVSAAAIVQSIADQARMSLVTNDRLAQLIEMEASRMQREAAATNEALLQEATRETLEYLRLASQLAVAQKTLGSFADSDAIEAAMQDFEACLASPSVCTQ